MISTRLPAAAAVEPAPSWRKPVAVGAAAVAGTALVALVDPTTNHVPLCPLLAATGLDCPACGSLRAVFSLTRADVGAALSHNLLFTVAVPFLVVGWAVWLARSVGGGLTTRSPRPSWVVPAAIAVAVAFGVARNLPAFAWLDSA